MSYGMWTPVASPGASAPPSAGTGGGTPPLTGGVTPLPFQPGTGGTTPLPNSGTPTIPGAGTGGGTPPLVIPGVGTGGGTPPLTGGVYPKPVLTLDTSDEGTPGQGIDESRPLLGGAGGGVQPIYSPANPPDSDRLPNVDIFRQGTPGQGIDESMPTTGGVYPKPVVRQPEWGPRVQPSFRRPGFWQAVRQMAQPSIGTSAANQARAQQQQSNAARARAAFLAGFNNVRRPVNQYPQDLGGGPARPVNQMNVGEQFDYAGGSRNFDESAPWPLGGGMNVQSPPGERVGGGMHGGPAPYTGGINEPTINIGAWRPGTMRKF